VITPLADKVYAWFQAMDLGITPASAGAADAGKIVVVARLANGSAAIARYTTTGSLDTSFAGGVVAVPGSEPSVAIQDDGRIVVCMGSSDDVQLLRLNTNGAFDTSFGSGGQVLTGERGNQYPSVAIQPDGKIVAAGDAFDPATGLGGNFFV